MPAIIHCQIVEPLKPASANLIQRVWLWLAQLLGSPADQVTLQFDLILDSIPIGVEQGRELTIDAKTLNRKSAGRYRVEKIDGEIKNGSLSTTATLRELKPPPLKQFYESLNGNTRIALTTAFILVTVSAIAASVYAITQFPEPVWFWAWFGQNVRMVVTVALGLLFLVATLWSNGKLEGLPQDFTSGLFGLLTMGAPIGWWMMSAPPQSMDHSSQGSIDYVRYLFSQWQTTAPMLVGAVPWLAMVFKWFGWDSMTSLTDMMMQGVKKDN